MMKGWGVYSGREAWFDTFRFFKNGQLPALNKIFPGRGRGGESHETDDRVGCFSER